MNSPKEMGNEGESPLSKSSRKLEGLIYSVGVNVNMTAGVVGWDPCYNSHLHKLSD